VSLKEKILGFTLFAHNIESAAQLIELNKELKSLAKQVGYDIVIAVDQEGGKVERLPSPFSKIKPMRDWGDIFSQTGRVEPLYELGKILGSEVRAAGFNLDFAPVVDVDLHSANPIIGNRSFSSHPEVVYKLARQVIRGLLHEGMIPCLKHFPGHGATTKDSHLELPHDNRPADKIFRYDILPFKKLIEEDLAPTIMTAHVVYSELDKKNPATLSEKIIKEILREKLNYDGMVFFR
jgi:beta-N-acetylhexosaminidase